MPALAPGRRTFAVEVSFDAAEVRPQWEQLESQGTPFQTRAWLLPWHRVLAPQFGATPLFVTVRDERTGRPLMFLPLCLRRRHGLATIEFPDLGVSDYNTALLAPDLGLGAADMRNLWDRIRRALPPADVVRFDKVPATVCGRDNPLARLGWVHPMAMRAWTLPLPPTRDVYDRGVLCRRALKEHRRKHRHLAAQCGELRLCDAATPRDGGLVFQALRNERKARFRKTGRSDLLDDPRFAAFYRAVIFDQWNGFAALSALKAGDRIVASLFALRHGGAYLLLMHSFEPGLERLSPGIVAIDALVTHRIACGDRWLDFTVGDEAYKRRFGAEEAPLVAGLYPLSLRGRLYVLAWPWARRARDWLAALLAACRKRLARRPARAESVSPRPRAGAS